MKKERKAFTLVELLVVIAIIGILVAMLLPAVQAAREAARKMQCGSNMKQIGTAILTYESTHNRFPPGAGGGVDSHSWGFGWSIPLLPYAEQKSLYDQLDHLGETCTGGGSQGQWHHVGYIAVIEHGANLQNGRVLTDKKIPFLVCPSSELADVMKLEDKSGAYATGPEGAMSACYASITGSSNHRTAIDRDVDTGGVVFPPSGIQSKGGIMTPYNGVSFKEITDGASNTIMVGEQSDWCYDYYGGQQDPRSGINCSIAMGANGANDVRTNRWFGAMTVRYPVNTRNWRNAGMAGGNPGQNLPIISPHPGGAHAVKGDGAVIFLNEKLELQTLWNLADRDDGHNIEGLDDSY